MNLENMAMDYVDSLHRAIDALDDRRPSERLLQALDDAPAISLFRLAAAAGIDYSLAWRALHGLIQTGLVEVERRPDGLYIRRCC